MDLSHWQQLPIRLGLTASMQAAIPADRSASLQVAQRISALEDELRRSKRREEKLAALQYRLREDLKQNGGSTGYSTTYISCNSSDEQPGTLHLRLNFLASFRLLVSHLHKANPVI